MQGTESTSMKVWQGAYSRIIPHYVFSLELSVPPPVPFTHLESSFVDEYLSGNLDFIESLIDTDANAEDLRDGLETQKRYLRLGTKEFIPYSDYLKTRTRG